MKVLFTGKGSSGSWQMRGVQIAGALQKLGIYAATIPKASVEQCRAADVIVLVKRPNFELMDAIQASGKPFAHDIVDAWPQPEGNAWDAQRALTWLRTTVKDVKPDLLICATRDMLADAEYPSACVIYHHARPEYNRSIPKIVDSRNVMMLGYEGGSHYLGKYPRRMECLEDSGYKVDFMWNQIIGAHVAICLRDTIGYAPRHWKSNVKLANAQALGIPALCSPESGYRETSTGGVLWIESPDDLRAAFDTLADPTSYAALCAAVDAPPTLEQIAAQYRDLLVQLC